MDARTLLTPRHRRTGIAKKIAVNKLPEPLESDIKKQIIQYLNGLGIDAWAVELSGNTYTKNGKTFQKPNAMAGFPDIMGVLPKTGELLAIEVKRRKGVVTALQRSWIERLRASNAHCFVARDVATVIEWANFYL